MRAAVDLTLKNINDWGVNAVVFYIHERDARDGAARNATEWATRRAEAHSLVQTVAVAIRLHQRRASAARRSAAPSPVVLAARPLPGSSSSVRVPLRLLHRRQEPAAPSRASRRFCLRPRSTRRGRSTFVPLVSKPSGAAVFAQHPSPDVQRAQDQAQRLRSSADRCRNASRSRSSVWLRYLRNLPCTPPEAFPSVQARRSTISCTGHVLTSSSASTAFSSPPLATVRCVQRACSRSSGIAATDKHVDRRS